MAGRGGPRKSRFKVKYCNANGCLNFSISFKAKAKAKAKESDSLTNSSWDPSSDDEDDDESTTEEYCEADLTKSTGKVIIKTEAEDRPLRSPVPLPPLKSSSAVVRDNQALVGISFSDLQPHFQHMVDLKVRIPHSGASTLFIHSTPNSRKVEPIDLTADTPPPPSATESISPKPAMASIKKPTLVRGVIVSRESIGGVPLAGVLARPGSSSDNSLSSQSKVHDLTDSTMPRASRPTSTSFPSPQISRTADHAPLSPPLPPLPDLKTFLKGTPNIDYDLSELHCALEAEGMGTIEQLLSFASWEEEELHTLFKTAIPDINVAQEFTMVRRLKMRAVELGRIPGAGPISTGDKS
ncbi:hypothetical protein H0H92_004432 [Tricholoma furcatifolium]|nr:hypothetical protein H0H92_004432 [Tricholoma furcatifolium]